MFQANFLPTGGLKRALDPEKAHAVKAKHLDLTVSGLRMAMGNWGWRFEDFYVTSDFHAIRYGPMDHLSISYPVLIHHLLNLSNLKTLKVAPDE